jgi:DNA-directed RNA polymerase specialized sigma24 family protein
VTHWRLSASNTWYPLYAYLRRTGHTATDAEDLTQSFFLRLLEKDALQVVDRGRGRFRSFLITALKHFVANEWDRRRAKKRGGLHPPIAFELSTGEHRYRVEPRDDSTPETLYDRQWALTVLDRTIGRLRSEFRTAGKAALFDQLRRYLTPDDGGPSYADRGGQRHDRGGGKGGRPPASPALPRPAAAGDRADGGLARGGRGRNPSPDVGRRPITSVLSSASADRFERSPRKQSCQAIELPLLQVRARRS